MWYTHSLQTSHLARDLFRKKEKADKHDKVCTSKYTKGTAGAQETIEWQQEKERKGQIVTQGVA